MKTRILENNATKSLGLNDYFTKVSDWLANNYFCYEISKENML